MPVASGVETAGRAAFAELERVVFAGWERLSSAERQSVGASSAERFFWRVLADLRRLGGKPLLRINRASVAARFKRSGLPHLQPGGPAAQREARRLTAKEYAIDRRAFDNLDWALSYGRHSFTIKQLLALRRSVEAVKGNLRLLQSTPLGIRDSRKALASKLIPTLSRGLNWYSKRFLRGLIRDAQGIRARELRVTRRVILSLINDIEVVTGRRRLKLLVDILNWRAPRVSGDWTPRLLERWIAEDARSRNRDAPTRQRKTPA
jgi:hypothetical protein